MAVSVWQEILLGHSIWCARILKRKYLLQEILNWFQGILGLAYPVIAQPDRNVVSWLDAAKRLRNYQSITFALELCGSVGDGDRQTGMFEIVGKTVGSIWKHSLKVSFDSVLVFWLAIFCAELIHNLCNWCFNISFLSNVWPFEEQW